MAKSAAARASSAEHRRRSGATRPRPRTRDRASSSHRVASPDLIKCTRTGGNVSRIAECARQRCALLLFCRLLRQRVPAVDDCTPPRLTRRRVGAIFDRNRAAGAHKVERRVEAQASGTCPSSEANTFSTASASTYIESSLAGLTLHSIRVTRTWTEKATDAIPGEVE